MKRALRLDKIRLAALWATLRLYRDPTRLAERLPTLRLLTRKSDEIAALARRLLPSVQQAVAGFFAVDVVGCRSEIGSGALPLETLPSAALAFTPAGEGGGRQLAALSAAMRDLPIPVIGRVTGNALLLDLRCLEDEAGLLAALSALDVSRISGTA
jgi:L-seryl-tRNA(Ser) seleniumtransferase